MKRLTHCLPALLLALTAVGVLASGCGSSDQTSAGGSNYYKGPMKPKSPPNFSGTGGTAPGQATGQAPGPGSKTPQAP